MRRRGETKTLIHLATFFLKPVTYFLAPTPCLAQDNHNQRQLRYSRDRRRFGHPSDVRALSDLISAAFLLL